MLAAHRPLPERKTLGTRFNLCPDTRRVPAGALRVGDVVMEGPEHPAVIARIDHPFGNVRIMCRYVWQEPYERTWRLGDFHRDHRIARALPDEYPQH